MRFTINRSRGILTTGLAALVWLGCTDDPTGPPPPPPLPPDSPELVLSDPTGPGASTALASIEGGGTASVVFLSLPPGTVPGAEFVVIRNLAAGDADGMAVPVVDGGFDPVVLAGGEGDRLELEFHGGGTILARKYGTVPRSRPPTIVRIAPPKGRTDVALAVRPTVVFSEPVDPASLSGAVRLIFEGAPVAGQVVARQGEPWAVEFIPDVPLQPAASYELDVAATVRDLDGEVLAVAARSDFTTGTLAPPPPTPPGPGPIGRIAFVSTRHGGPWIYLANVDGSNVVPLVRGEAPAWSWDGQRIAFHLGYELRTINADGSGERLVASNARYPAWAPGDTRLAFRDGPMGWESGIGVVNADRSDRRVLIPSMNMTPWDYGMQDDLTTPAWAPDGRSIAFVRDSGGYEQRSVRIYVASADGSGLQARPTHVGGIEAPAWNPSWSPDGEQIVFESQGVLDPTRGLVMDWIIVGFAADGSGERTIRYRASLPEPAFPQYAGQPDWSPDGKQLAFTREVAGIAGPDGPPLRIFVVDAETGIERQLIPEVTGAGVMIGYRDSEVAWSRVIP